jgi:hypothetical protein
MNAGEWQSVLKLATMWELIGMRTLAIQQLDKLKLSAIDKVLLGKEYKVPCWLPGGYEELVKDPATISNEDAKKLGWKTAARLLRVRDMHAKSYSRDCRASMRPVFTLKCTCCNRSWENQGAQRSTSFSQSAFGHGTATIPRPHINPVQELMSTLRVEFQEELEETKEADRLIGGMD